MTKQKQIPLKFLSIVRVKIIYAETFLLETEKIHDSKGVEIMVLIQEVKESILLHLKNAEASLEKADFSDVIKAGVRLFILPELISDEKWKKEFYLSGLVLTTIGSAVEKETVDSFTPEKRAMVTKEFARMMRMLQDAIATEKFNQFDDTLRELAMKYYVEFGV